MIYNSSVYLYGSHSQQVRYSCVWLGCAVFLGVGYARDVCHHTHSTSSAGDVAPASRRLPTDVEVDVRTHTHAMTVLWRVFSLFMIRRDYESHTYSCERFFICPCSFAWSSCAVYTLMHQQKNIVRVRWKRYSVGCSEEHKEFHNFVVGVYFV